MAIALASLGPGCALGGGPHDAGADVGDAPAPAKRVFVTSQSFNGDLRTAGGMRTGIESADAICQLYAEAGALGGTWIAWISDASTDAIDRVPGEGPWKNLLGIEVFRNRASLQVSSPLASLAYDEQGNERPGHAWTGTDEMGQRARSDDLENDQMCRNWTFGGDTSDWVTAYIGDPSSLDGRAWTHDDWIGMYPVCSGEHALLCFEQ